MKLYLITLVDITETQARFDKFNSEWHKQQNFITVTQVLGLRSNPTIDSSPVKQDMDLKGLGFGSRYKGTKTVWKLPFYYEKEESVFIDDLNQDFHLIPVITNLDETVNIKDSVFDTSNKQTCNIVFKYSD